MTFNLKTNICIVILFSLMLLVSCVDKEQNNTDPDPAEVQPRTVAIYNLGSHPILDDSVTGIKDSLATEGFSEDMLDIIEVNANFEMDKLNAFAIELLAVNPDVIIPVSTPVTGAVLNEASTEQKIIFSTVTDPSDFMASNPPNLTGVCDVVDFEANFNLILELFPDTKVIGMIYDAGDAAAVYGVEQFEELVNAADGIELRLVSVANSQEVVDAAIALVDTVDVFYNGSDNTVTSAMSGYSAVAYEAGIPIIASDSGSVRDGALAAVSVVYSELGEKVGEIVAEILRTGEMPADLEPVKFVGDKLILNEASAAELGFEFPDEVTARAYEIIR